MRIFKTKWFTKWAKKERLSDTALREAIDEIEQGLVDAKLSDFVYKKRIAQPGHGKRGSTRTILAFKTGEKAFFIFGFAKNETANINDAELRQLKILASKFLNYSDVELKTALKERELTEVTYHD
jgi:hypothetical protein